MATEVQNPQAQTGFGDADDDLTYGDIVWTQFRRNKVALGSLYAIFGLVAFGTIAPLLACNQPFVWELDGVRTYPWFAGLFNRLVFENPVDIFFNLLLVAGPPLAAIWFLRVRQLQAGSMTKRARRRSMRFEGGLLLLLFLGIYGGIIAVPYQATYTTYPKLMERIEAQGTSEVSAVFPPLAFGFRDTGFRPLAGPGGNHLLGVDTSGRDVAVRLLYGIRVSLTIGVVAVAIYVTIGIILGASAGFFGGRTDLAIQRLIEIFMCMPVLFVIITLIAFLEQASIFHIMVLIGLLRWTGVARLTRGEFLRLRNQDFVTAAEALGYRRRTIIFKQILPNALGPVLVAAAFGVAAAILLESTLSFLGLGDVSAPSWGQTLKEGYSSGKWHLILSPGFAIFFTVSVLNLVGEGLRDALDPKLRQ